MVVVAVSTSLAFAKGTGGSSMERAGYTVAAIDVIGIDEVQLADAFTAPPVVSLLQQCVGTERMLAWIELQNGSVKSVQVGGSKIGSLERCIASALRKAKIAPKDRIVATLHVDPIPPPPPRPEQTAKVTLSDPQRRNGTRADSDITSVIKGRLGVFRAYYLRELNHVPGIHGRVDASVRITSTGTVGDASLRSTTLNNPSVESCITGNIQRLAFPAGHEDEVTFFLEFLN
jgi:hypothetical protein